AIRRALPLTIARLGTQRAAAILVAQLDREPDGAIRFRILRALTRMRRSIPGLELDPGPLERYADRTVRRACEALAWRRALEAAAARDTPARALLHALLIEKEHHAIERLFLILGLRDARAEYALVYGGVRSHDRQRRDAALEIIGNLVAPPRRDLVLALVEDLPDDERLRRAAETVPPLDEALAAMAKDHSPVLRSLVEYLEAA